MKKMVGGVPVVGVQRARGRVVFMWEGKREVAGGQAEG